MKVLGVLVDLDDTLYEYKKCNAAANREILAKIKNKYGLSQKNSMKLFERSREEVKKLVRNQAASHSRLLYFKRLTELVEGRTNVSFALYLEKIFWRKYFRKMKLKKEAQKFLKVCRKNNIKVCIITNLTAQVQLLKIQKLKIKDLVDFVVTSEEVGVEKPSSKIIIVALKKMNCRKSEVIFVGDRHERAAAKNARVRFFLVSFSKEWKRATKSIIGRDAPYG